MNQHSDIQQHSEKLAAQVRYLPKAAALILHI